MTARPRTGSTMIDVLVSLIVLSVSSASVIPLLLAVQRTSARTIDLRHATAMVQHVQGYVASAPCTPASGAVQQGRLTATWSLTHDGARLHGEAIIALPATPYRAAQQFAVPLRSVCVP